MFPITACRTTLRPRLLWTDISDDEVLLALPCDWVLLAQKYICVIFLTPGVSLSQLDIPGAIIGLKFARLQTSPKMLSLDTVIRSSLCLHMQTDQNIKLYFDWMCAWFLVPTTSPFQLAWQWITPPNSKTQTNFWVAKCSSPSPLIVGSVKVLSSTNHKPWRSWLS